MNDPAESDLSHLPRRAFLGGILAMAAGSGRAAPDKPAPQRLLFQRSDTLYALGPDDAAAPRKLFAVGPVGTLWAASPEGRRIAWVTRRGTDSALGMAARPAVVFVSDFLGRHQKTLIQTGAIHDRLGRPVAAWGGVEGADTGAGDWEPVSLSWSADGRTIYLSCASVGGGRAAKATFGADSASGAALVDADGRWKSIAPVTFLDSRGGLLAGSGAARFAAPGGGDPIPYAPILVINLAEGGTRTPLFAAGTTPDLPAYAFAAWVALSPDNGRVAFTVAGSGLWLTDRRTPNYRLLIEGAVVRPRWASDGTRLRFLLARPRTAAPDSAAPTPAYDLYEITVPDAAGNEAIPLRLLLQNVDAFDLVGA